MTSTELMPITADEMRQATSGAGGLPVEQSEAWDTFSHTQGHEIWGRFAWKENDKTCAVVALHEHRLRSWRFLWAKSGPVWIKEATPEREAAFRAALAEHVRKADSGFVFIRLHAWYSAPDLADVLQTITYDRTVIIDCAKGDRDAILETMPTAGRRAVRRAIKKCGAEGVTITEETGITPSRFREYYDVMKETAERDGFRPHPAQVYLALLDALGPEHARLFTARDESGELLCWDLVLLNAKKSQAEYGASTGRGRAMGAPVLLDFETAAILGAEGVTGLDLRGMHSPRVPELFTVGKYKLNFAATYTDIAGAWELPLRPTTYKALRAALNVKRRLGR